jgi:predicted phage terminase large subunit-like protein
MVAHARFCHRDDENQPLLAYDHHREWVEVLEDREQFPWVGIVAPPGYAKSTWGSWVYPSWRIGHTKGKVRIALVSNTAELAWGWADAIKETIQGERFKMAYPGVEPDFSRGWRHNAFFTNGTPPGLNPTLAAMGIGGAIQGRRVDEIILDDPTTFEQALSPGVMLKQRNWLKNTLIKRLPAGRRPPSDPAGRARIVVIFTRWGPNDLHDTLVDLGFQIIHMPALGYLDATYDEDGNISPGIEPLWPEMDPYENLVREREKDELTFELVMQGNAQVVTGEMFDPAWWAENRGAPPQREDFDRVVTAVDTASGKDAKKGDYFVAATLGKHGTDVWVIDIVRGRFNAVRQEDQVKQAYGLHKADIVVIESANEGEALYQRLVAQHEGIPLRRFQPVKDKAFRASPLAAAYRQGHIWHARAGWNMPYEAELAAFPSGPHDDQVDAVAMAYSNISRRGPQVVAV